MLNEAEHHAFEALALAAERGELVPIPETAIRGEEFATLLEQARREHSEDVEGLLGALFDIVAEGRAAE
ncbi:hypothetical protein [Microbacterium maritypicum]|uniref:Uncharacterized protein n=1 Tax=Microbacterium maritypicum TaxID=33918 RepID=A0A4Y4BAJ0_MICMQ|nr:hypothetical protein [Microbacterium liquefaciens]GEC75867.1 hypothetical protein MLI01_20120 [Microbacterium liquefaciens]GGV57094.1 hypothetical protein GCM10010213_18000 [Microbacterium liquefaciens]